MTAKTGNGYYRADKMHAIVAKLVAEKTEKMAAEVKALKAEVARLKRHIANPDFCAAHGVQRCIECEKRCQWCGDDGDMVERAGVRVCENCDYEQEQEEQAETAAQVSRKAGEP